MAIDSLNASFYADPAALGAIKRDAAAQSPEALRETAKQFESLFTSMMLKSMRAASPGDPYASDQQDFYQDMFDQQLAAQLSKGKGLGLADVLVRQLMQGQGDAVLPGVAGLLPPGQPDAMPAAAGAPAASNWPPRNADEFVRLIRPAATAAARELGVDPDVVIAHAALETGWGRSVPTAADGRPSFNLFGIKAGGSWKGAVHSAGTHEFLHGSMQQVRADFRAYGSPEQSIQDYVGLLKSSPRYAGALNTGADVQAFARGLARGGYATDPDYVTKLTAVAARLKSAHAAPITQASSA
jgi:flagellar protein FlgJ